MNLKFISDPLQQFFVFLHNGVHTVIPNNNFSYGLTIILFTIIIRIVLLPLNIKQIRSTVKMGELQPEMKKLQEKYKNDPQKSQMEIMKLYKEHNVSPLSGCLPLLVQMPILFALFYVFTNLNMHNASFLWLNNLAKPDQWYILPILSTITTYISSKLMQPSGAAAANNPQAKQMSTMNTVMAVFFGFMSINIKSALVLYWVINNTFQIGQTLVMKKMDVNKKEAIN